jgi:hypothetical protein
MPFTQGVLNDIPSHEMPEGGLTEGYGVKIEDGWVERRKGFVRINDCEHDEYIMGIMQYQDRSAVNYIFYGDINYLYKIELPQERMWDDGWYWWDTEDWDEILDYAVYQLSPTGETQICPPCSTSSSSSSVSSSSKSSSSSSTSSFSSSSSASCATEVCPFDGRAYRYLAIEATPWVFTSFGNNVIATNYMDPIVYIPGSDFDHHEVLECNGLRAKVVDTFQRHVLCLNVRDHVDGVVPNRYWSSGLDDASDFDYTNPASEALYGDLTESPMPITGGARIRDSYVIFQTNMMHMLNYVGGDSVYSKQVINNEIGALWHRLVATTGDRIFFFGLEDIFEFDGYQVKSIGANNNGWIFEGLNMLQISRAFSFIDMNTKEVHFVIPYNEDIPNLDCIYDFQHGLWTFDTITATAGCPKVGLSYPIIARVSVTRSSSFSSSSMSSSSSFSSSSISISSSSSSVMYDWDRLNDDCSSLMWTKVDKGDATTTQVTFDGRSCFKLDSGPNSAANNDYAMIRRNLGSFDATTTIEITGHWDLLGRRTDNDYFSVRAYNGTTRLLVAIASNGLHVYDGAAYNEVGTDIVILDTWQTFRLIIDWVAKTVDIYLDGDLVAAGVDCSHDVAGTNGGIYLYQYGHDTDNCISYIDSIKVDGTTRSESFSSSSSSSESHSSSSSSQSESDPGTQADSYLQYVGVGNNDDDWARESYWVTGEYRFDSARIKEFVNMTAVIGDLIGDLECYIGTRNNTDDAIIWEHVQDYTEQVMIGARQQGVYISFKFIARDLDDYYRISEIKGILREGGER